MTNSFPIPSPPPELVEQWADASARTYRENGTYAQHEFALATQAAQWGADQELEACCEALRVRGAASVMIKYLRTSRRPKPPSLKEQALTAMLHLQKAAETNMDTIEAVHIICRALEALPND